MKWQAKHTSLVVIAIGFAILYLLFKNYWLFAPVAIAAIGFAISPLGEMIHQGWLMLAKVLGYVNSRILLSIIFFFILTPIALLMRLLGKPQYEKKEGVQKSLFVNRNYLYNRHDLKHPF